MSDVPSISVNMPVYNGVKYLKQAIDSILNQTYTDFELIIIDDGSTDTSVDLIKSYRDPRIKLFQNNLNRGLAFSRNRAIEQSKGKYIAILDSDDIAYPERIKKQLDFLEKNPDYVMIGSWIDIIDENDQVSEDGVKLLVENDLLRTQLFFSNHFAQSSLLIRRSVFEEFSYNESYIQAEDYFLWVQIASKYKVANLQESLVQYRVHQESITMSKFEDQENCVKQIFVYQLSQLGLNDLKNDEIELHYKLLRYKYDAKLLNWVELKRILKWILKLQKQNNKYKIYVPIFFNSKLELFWSYYFDYSFYHGPKAIQFLFNSFNQRLPFKRKVRFTLKCLNVELQKYR